MRNRLSVVLLAAFAVCLILALPIAAKDITNEKSTFHIDRAPKYAIPYEDLSVTPADMRSDESVLRQIGRIPTASPGFQAGLTTYDYQHNGSSGRQVAHRTSMIHFIWMAQSTAVIPGDRRIRYQAFDASTNVFQQPLGGFVADADYAGYCSTDGLIGGQAFFGYHASPGGGGGNDYRSRGSYDFIPGFGSFTTVDAPAPPGYVEVIWPITFVHYGATDSVAYMLSHAGNNDASDSLVLYKMYLSDKSQWTITSFKDDAAVLSYIVVAQPGTDKVAVVYSDDRSTLANGAGGQTDLDVYYKQSTDLGVTWGPKVNVSNYTLDSLWRAYSDLSAVYDPAGNLHVSWPARELKSSTIYENAKCRLIHWSEDIPNARVISEARYDLGSRCDPGAWNMYIAKNSISWCDSKMYAEWTQFGERKGPGFTDCSQLGYANGDLYLAVSSDNGLSWDLPTNLTNSRTPNCDSALCESDHWSSMAMFGMIYPGVDSLDIVYVNDKDAGGIPQGEGTWCVNPVMYYRFPCRAPIPSSQVSLFPNSFLDPLHVAPATFKDTSFVIQNIGNATLNYSVSDGGAVFMDITNPGDGTTPSGSGNTDVVSVRFNPTLIAIDPSGHDGFIVVTSDAPTSPDSMPVHLTIASDFDMPEDVVINTTYKKLRVYNTGRHGGGDNETEQLDIRGDCDSGKSSPNGSSYLYDGSPVLSWMKPGTPTAESTAYATVFSQIFTEEGTWRPQTPLAHGLGAGYDSVSYTMSSSDSIFQVKVATYAVTTGGFGFVVEKVEFSLWPGATSKSGLNLGYVCDYDTPADQGSNNASDTSQARNAVWQRGAESGPTAANDEIAGCPILETNRAGGIAVLSGAFANTWSFENIPAQEGSGYRPGHLVKQMSLGTKYNLYYIAPPDPDTVIDLHTGITFERNVTIGTTDKKTYVIALVTSNAGKADFLAQVDAAQAWAAAKGLLSCCNTAGDANNDNAPNVGDAVYLINRVFKGGNPPPCPAEGDPNKDGSVNVGDAVFMINRVFKGGAAPQCGTAQ